MKENREIRGPPRRGARLMAKDGGRRLETIIARLRYEFDKALSAGTMALIGWLALLSAALVTLAALVLALTGLAPEGGDRLGFLEALWAALMRTLDGGTMGADAGWGFRIVMLAVTIAGIFVVSTLIAILGSGIERKRAELRKGRTRVLESDHTLILNWSASIVDIVSELSNASAARRKPRIVILAERDKAQMEDEIAARAPDLGATRVICRSGDPTNLRDLELVSPRTARAIIVLSPEGAEPGGDDPDSRVIKTILALVNDPARHPEPYRIAAEIRDGRNAGLARAVGGTEVQLVRADDLVARIAAHSVRQAGMSAVYSKLLDPKGCGIHTLEQPELYGNAFGEAVMAYETATLIGMCDVNGRVYLNPPMETQFAPGIKAILIVGDDAAIGIATSGVSVDMAAIAPPHRDGRRAERTLMLGWNRRAPLIAFELGRCAAPGSLLTIAADVPGLEQEVAAMPRPGPNLAVEFGRIDTTHRPTLEGLGIPSYDHVLVLGHSDTMAPQPTDTRTLVTLLQLRQIAEAAGVHINVVSEMTDMRNRELAEVTRADDFVVSNRLAGLMLARASENEQLCAIFDDLLDEAGPELCMRPVEHYIALGRPVTFHTVVEACRQRGEVAIGYLRRREGAADRRSTGGVVVNPKKSEALLYAHGDRFIVLARE